MHIPDGYLGPKTYGVMYGVMIPIWYIGSRVLKKSLKVKQIPFVALAASFSFIIMMFNIPIPGGSTGHAVGSTLIAILLGPWVALLSVSIALIIQALLFGDGGITAIGANCFNMAFLMPFSGYYLYKILSKFGKSIKWKSISAGIAGYVSLNLAALVTAIQFGMQPYLERGVNGKALYCPYDLSITVPVMTFGHLAIFGFAEALATGAIVAYILRNEKSFFAEYGYRNLDTSADL